MYRESLLACRDQAGVFDALMDVTGAIHGGAKTTGQVMEPGYRSLRLIAHRGVTGAFVRHFTRVDRYDGSVCSQAMLKRAPVIIFDVLTDVSTRAHNKVFSEAGVRTVISVPLISQSGTFYGMVSALKSQCEEPTETAMATTQAYATAAADQIARIRAKDRRIAIPLNCKCGQTGTALWEENAPGGLIEPEPVLIRLDGFYERVARKPPYQIELACLECGAVQPDYDRGSS